MSQPSRGTWRFTLALMVLGLVLIAVRVLGLDSYPALHPDEGFWASGASNQVKHGDALMDGRLHPFLSPATFVTLTGYFAVVGPSLLSARLFSVATGLLACLLTWVLGRRYFPQRPWLLLLLFGLSGLSVLVQRMGLLESHQMLWLLLAATLWLSGIRGRTVLAGGAYGIALLIKSNSIYLLPAFLLAAPGWGAEADGRTARFSFRTLALFLLTVALVGGGGYGVAWAVNPEAFVSTFRFELDGVHLLDDSVVFHVGRFGLHRHRLPAVLKGLVLGEPFLVVGAALALLFLVRRPGAASRADRFFAAWAVGGFGFYFAQIYVEHRYLTTLAPALAYLAARVLDPMMARREVRWRPIAAMAFLGLFIVFHVVRIGEGIRRRSADGYWETAAWVDTHVPHDAKVLAAPYVGLSLPQRTYDFFRMLHPYGAGQTHRSLAEVVQRQGIAILIVDAEWREYHGQDAAMTTFLASRCRVLHTVGGFTVFQVEGGALAAGR